MSSSLFALTLFGPFEASINGQPYTGFATDKIRALLAYLAIESSQTHRRDTLAALLWPDYPQETALRNLRQALYRLRLGLEEAAPSLPDQLLIQSRQTVTLNPEALSLDTAQVSQYLREAKTSPEPIPYLTGISDLYRGELLKGFHIPNAYAFDEWLTIQREIFHQQALDALSRLATLHEASRNTEAVLATARNILALDPWHEKTYRQLMRAHMEQGNRAQALAQYHKLKELLQADLGVEPAAVTTMLYEQIQTDSRLVKERTETTVRPSQLHHFPIPLTPLIGRKAELDYLSQTLQDDTCRLLTITGPGGMGKTRLATETARRLLAQTSRFPDGLYFISLAQVENDNLFLATIAQSLDFSLPPRVEPRQALLNYLKTKRLLLLLDNFEHLLGHAGEAALPVAVSFLTETLVSAPGVTCLVTSREPLALQGEWVYSLGGLPYAVQNGETDQEALDLPAPQLFIQCARRYRSSFDPATQAEAIGEICRLTGGLPLALEIAAAWMRSYDCQEIARLINQGLDFLTNPYRDAPVRQRSIRAVFTSTWEQLDPEQQAVMAAMSVFRGDFTVEAAVSVAQASVLNLAILVEKSLLRRAEGGRYDLHELVHQFAVEKLAESGTETAVRQRHAAFYLTFLKEQYSGLNGPAPQEALTPVRQTMDNIRAAWQWAATNRQIALVRQAAETLAQYLVLTGSLREGEETFTQALHALQPISSPESLTTQSLLASHLAWFQIGLGKNQAAQENLTIALALPEQGRELSGRAYALSVLGWNLQTQGQYEEAEKALSEAVDLFQRTNNPLQTSLAFIRLGSLYWRKQDYDRTLAYYQESLEIEQQLQNKRGINRAYGGLGLVHEFTGNYDEALEWLNKALILDRELDNSFGVIRNLGNMGSLYHKLGDYPQALLCYQEAAKIERDSRHKTTLGVWLGAIASIYRQVGEQELAQKYYDQAIALHEESGDRYNLCSTYLGKAELYMMREEYARATVLIEQAKQVAGEVRRQDILFQAGLVEARLLGKTGQEENGRQQLEAMLPPQVAAGKQEEVAHIYYELWQIENRPEYASRAVAAYQAAFALAPKGEYSNRIAELTTFLTTGRND
jgi:DNA-binding SARP family transcriptional activator/predicted ATPase